MNFKIEKFIDVDDGVIMTTVTDGYITASLVCSVNISTETFDIDNSRSKRFELTYCLDKKILQLTTDIIYSDKTNIIIIHDLLEEINSKLKESELKFVFIDNIVDGIENILNFINECSL